MKEQWVEDPATGNRVQLTGHWREEDENRVLRALAGVLCVAKGDRFGYRFVSVLTADECAYCGDGRAGPCGSCGAPHERVVDAEVVL